MNTTIFFVCFSIYMALMVFIGWRVSRGQSGEDYLIGSRGINVFLIIGTMLATQVGTGSSMGASGFGYTNGWAGLLYGVGGFASIVLVALLFADVRKYGFLTMSEEISFYYGANKYIKSIVSILIYIASVGWLGAHILGGSMYLSWVTGIDLLAAKLITVLGFGIYVTIGGYLAVVWTDAIQSIILFVGFIVVAIMSIPEAGGFEAIRQAVPNDALSFLGIEKYGVIPAISLLIAITVGGLAVPSFRHRIYSGKDVKSVKKGFLWTAGLYAIFAVFPVIIGMSAFTINPSLENSSFAIPFMAMEVLPAGLGMLILIAGLSATMSSGDSDAIAGVTILMTDIYSMVFGKMPDEDKMVRNSRIATVLTLGIAFVMAAGATNITNYIANMISTTLSGLAVASIMGKYWKRATWQGGLAALIGGSICSILATNSGELMELLGDPTIPSLAGAFIACVVVSLMTSENKVSREEALRLIQENRKK
ncbi:sodium:solute symporter family protein [Maledivibacter halophilus]|uniref:Solute:Na+ symporter, SSS family n=1 Tax=Maledivibacter halophilus TaxID=36842 RepID=A0A1T5MDL5_9FIRM|nr:sodium:solute symporter family protein [Maledivibacter halophilus]SKC86310.1 solute:Na+ symporter, SSS family [Maledivibacter halophilus]